jgi:signal transduction histidine kinase
VNTLLRQVEPRSRPFWLSPARLAVLYVVVFAFSVGAIVGAIYVLTQRALERETDSIINAELEGLKDDFRLGGLQRLVDTLDLRSDSWGRTGAVYVLIDAQHKPIAGNIRYWPPGAWAATPWIEFTIADQAREDVADHPVRASITRLDASHLLLVGTDVSENLRFFRRFRAAMYWGIGLAVLLAALVGYVYVKRVAARVHSVAEACASIMAGKLSRRLEVSASRDEFDALAVIVNEMLDRLEHQAATLRTTFDSTAHDLRAPLHRVRMRVEQALREPQNAASAQDALDATLVEIDRIQSTLTTLLEIARAEAGVENGGRDSVDLGALAQEVVELYVPEARARGLTLEVRQDVQCIVQGSRQLFAQLFANLFENALKFVPAGGQVEVSVKRSADMVTLLVADTGPGIPSQQRELVVQPFGRLERDRERPGSGLGLSLVGAIVGLYRGRIALEDNHPGLCIRCEFPAVTRN